MALCSYILLGLINFWNLTLVYGLLPISTNPEFSKKFLQRRSQTMNEDSFFQMFTDANFNFQFLEDENQSSNIQKRNSWFRGLMGLSCNFISNNLVNLISLAFLAVKFFILNKIIVKRFLRKLGFLGF